MARIRKRIQKRDQDKIPQVTPVVSSLESRPFDSEAEYSEGDYAPEIQAQEAGEKLGHDLADIPISARETTEEEMAVVQAKADDRDSAELIPEDEDQTPAVQAKEDSKEDSESLRAKSEEDCLLQEAQALYEQLRAGDEEAIATLSQSGLDVESLENLSSSEAIAQIQEILATDVAAETSSVN